MSVIFKKVSWKNFLSTGNDAIAIDLIKNPTTLIIGKNGHGKSTLNEAVTFALYGKPFRKINKPQLVNSINNKKCLVELDFTSNGNDYRVRRGIKPNIFEIYKNDILMNQDSNSRDYQDVLEKQILKLGYKSFCQIVMLGSASYVPFMELTAQSRREIIEDLLDLQIFTTMNTLLKDKVTKNDKDIMEIEQQIDVTGEKIVLQEKYIENIRSKTDQRIETLTNRQKELENEIEEAQKSVKTALKHIDELKSTINDQEKIEKKLNSMVKLEDQIDVKIRKIDTEIKFFDNNETCPTCKQLIDTHFKKTVIDERKTTVEETKNGLLLLKNELKNVVSRQQEIYDINKRISTINSEIFVKNTKIDGIKEQINTIIKDITELQSNNNTDSDDGIAALKLLEESLKKYAISKNEFLSMKEMYKFSQSMLKDTGIKSRIVKQYVPIINSLINKYLADMEFSVQFELDENFQETIKSRHRDIFSYASFSEGEKMRINLAILFTWRAIAKSRNSTSTNLLILDEVFDGSLDSIGTDEFMKILKSLDDGTNTFIISHKTDQLLDKFDRVLEFTKHNNFSKMKEL